MTKEPTTIDLVIDLKSAKQTHGIPEGTMLQTLHPVTGDLLGTFKVVYPPKPKKRGDIRRR